MEEGRLTSRAAVDELIRLLDEAFDGNSEHSLLHNLRSVPPEDWEWLPPTGKRSIRDIVDHIGQCKFMYENHAFGDGRMFWTDFEPCRHDGAEAWLREAHQMLRDSIAKLDDDGLDRPVKMNWGSMESARFLVQVMIQHDLYHAGEINHLRALRQADDVWEHEKEQPT